MIKTTKERIDMLRDNLEENEVNFNKNRITKQQYRIRKRDAQKRITELKG